MFTSLEEKEQTTDFLPTSLIQRYQNVALLYEIELGAFP